jgi:hypothetical protein
MLEMIAANANPRGRIRARMKEQRFRAKDHTRGTTGNARHKRIVVLL